jgi:hypothetical protein
MSEVNFGAGATPVETAAPETAAVPQNESQVPDTTGAGAVARPLAADYIPGFRDVILPALNIAHPVGEIGKTFPHGSIVYDNRVVLFAPPDIDTATGTVRRAALPPCIVTFLGIETPRYAEKVAGGARGIVVNTEQAVTASGGTLDYGEWSLKKAQGMKYFVPTVRAMVAIQRPEHVADDGALFVHEVNGLKYALAFWSFKASAYTAACKRVVFPAKLTGCLQKGYPAFSFAASTKLTPFQGGNFAWLPVLVPAKASTPEFLAFADKVLKG